jgi:hypothetical protein
MFGQSALQLPGDARNVEGWSNGGSGCETVGLHSSGSVQAQCRVVIWNLPVDVPLL